MYLYWVFMIYSGTNFARIVTDLPIFASSILIDKELGWELQMFYNIQNSNAPMYFCDLIPPTIQSTTVYPLRNGSDIIIILQTIDYLWLVYSLNNTWNPSLQNMEFIAKFKTELRKQKDIRQVPKHYEIGPRKLNIALT